MLSKILRPNPATWYREIPHYKYETIEPVRVETGLRIAKAVTTERGTAHLGTTGTLTVSPGFLWDGPSGPTFDTSSAMLSALVHDVGYRLIREGKLPPEYRKAFDELLYTVAVANGMWRWRALLWRRGVKRFAAYAVKPE